MSWRLFLRTWRAQRIKLALVAVALVIWGSLMPIIYEAFKEQIQILLGTRRDPAAVRPVRRRRPVHACPARSRSGSSTPSRSPSGSSSRWASR